MRAEPVLASPSAGISPFLAPLPPPALGGLLLAQRFVKALGCPLGMLCFWGVLEKFDLGGRGLNPESLRGFAGWTQRWEGRIASGEVCS